VYIYTIIVKLLDAAVCAKIELMVKLNQDGQVSGQTLALVSLIILLIVVIVFGAWAFSSRQDYKNNVDAKISAAVSSADKQQMSVDAAAAAQAAKLPLTTYDGPEDYGSIILKYPKTWSGYLDDSGNSGALLNGYFAPGIVPATDEQGAVYSLQLQVLSQSYAQTLQSLQQREQGTSPITVNAYTLPKLPSIVGVEATGNISGGTGAPSETVVVLPLRSYTIEISTEGTQYLSDFNNFILNNFSFSP
jgi:hypothetical protein